MHHNGEYKRALKKVHQHLKGEWCGYLRYTEILALLESGCTTNQQWVVDHATKRLAEGLMSCIWFYFKPSFKFLKDVEGI